MTKHKDLSPEDKKNWEDYIKNPSDVFDKDKSNSINTEKKSRFRFDLHGFTLDQANKKVKEINWKPDLILASYHGIPQRILED